jgi:hypothetical protein
MGPNIELFIPKLEDGVEEASTDSSSRGTVVQVPATWRGEDVHRASLLRAVWNGPLFPNYAHCQRWNEERYKDVAQLQVYLNRTLMA